ncbi:MAG: hypothetical protein OXM56_03830 [Gammaproteobacteria bacterium]|nr:hypothetical protein [Gammaproteobacteria bacterium]
MVSNFERILAEIRKEAGQIAPNYRVDPDSVVNLIMGIVDLEDQHRVKAQHGIKKKIRQMIETAAIQASEVR